MKKISRSICRLILQIMPTSLRVKVNYFRAYKKWPNVLEPTTFNEKVLNRILFDRNPIYPILADKYSVREFIKERIGDEVLIPLLLVTKDPMDLYTLQDWSRIVIKPNHGAGMINIFDLPPNEKEKQETIEQAKKWLSIDFSKQCDEWHYSLIEPLLLVERKITKINIIPRDYKFHCFKQKNGEIKFVLQLVDGRFGVESRGYYLNSLDDCVWSHGAGKHQLSEEEKEILKIAIELNKKIIRDDFNYIRIDWYIEDNRLYIGELTCTPGAGRSNEFGARLEQVMCTYWQDDN